MSIRAMRTEITTGLDTDDRDALLRKIELLLAALATMAARIQDDEIARQYDSRRVTEAEQMSAACRCAFGVLLLTEEDETHLVNYIRSYGHSDPVIAEIAGHLRTTRTTSS